MFLLLYLTFLMSYYKQLVKRVLLAAHIHQENKGRQKKEERKRGTKVCCTFLAKTQGANVFCATKACWGSPLCHCSNNNMWFGCAAPVYSGEDDRR